MQFTVWLEARAENGETASVAIARWHRCTSALTADEVGLSLAEGKALLAAAQRAVVGNQIDGYVTDARRCTCCGQLRKVHDRRTRTLQTLFGIVEVDAPRLKPCGCQGTDGQAEVISSPTAQLLSGRSTPELQRVQAELGARHSFREAARLLSNLLPCSRPNHATLRNRLHRAA